MDNKWEDNIIIDSLLKSINSEYITVIDKLQDYIDQISQPSFYTRQNLPAVRDAITFIDTIGYRQEYYERIDYKQKQSIVVLCNDFFNSLLSEQVLQLYNYFDKKFNKEKWNGECRYKLLDRTSNKGYTEISCLKAAVRFAWFMRTHETIKTGIFEAETLSKLIDRTPYWEFDHGTDYSLDIDNPQDFIKANEERKLEIAAQDKFVNLVINDKIIEAYEMLPDKDKI